MSRLIDMNEAPQSPADALAEIERIDAAASRAAASAARRAALDDGGAVFDSIAEREQQQSELRARVIKNLGRRLKHDPSWVAAQSDEDLRRALTRLAAEIQVVRGLWRASREVAHQRLDAMRDRAREDLARFMAGVTSYSITVADMKIPVGLADAWLVATSDELAAEMRAAVDGLPLRPAGAYGEITHESEDARRLDQATREDAMAAIETELERRAVDREQRALTERKKGLKERLGVKR